MKTAMVGYDARELWLDVNSQWNDKKKQQYLLRRDLVKPLSVDNYIWYSVFKERTVPHIWQNTLPQTVYRTTEWQDTFAENRQLVTPNLYHPRRIWTNLNLLKTFLQDNWGNDWKPCAIIAVQEMMMRNIDDEESLPIEPGVVGKDWRLLGYDVADYELYSGLHEGVITDALSARIKSEWVENLNEYHLFVDAEVAFAYIDFANVRNPTHRPYYVYALYLVQSVRSALLA